MQQHTRVRSARKAPFGAAVVAALLPAVAVVSLAALAAGAAHAAGPGPEGGDTVRRHGSVARLLWVPQGATTRVDGTYLSAGVVIGTRGALRSAIGPVAPAVVLELHQRSNLTLMTTGSRGAMLVWQHRL